MSRLLIVDDHPIMRRGVVGHKRRGAAKRRDRLVQPALVQEH